MAGRCLAVARCGFGVLSLLFYIAHTRETLSAGSKATEYFIEGLFSINYLLNYVAAKPGSRFVFIFRWYNIAWFVSIVSAVANATAFSSSLTTGRFCLGFLKIVVVYKSLRDVSRSDIPIFTPLIRQIINLGGSALVLLLCVASTVYTVETLGELPMFTDNVDAPWEWSIFSAMYFTLVTISTVGYGDFSPSTVLGRILVMGFLVIGIIHFSSQTGVLLQLMARESQGAGHFGNWARREFVILAGDMDMSTLEVFLHQFFHEDHAPRNQRLALVVLAHRSYSAETRRFLLSDPFFKDRVFYFKGTLMDPSDLKRVRASHASAVFIYSDPGSRDTTNILRVLSLKHMIASRQPGDDEDGFVSALMSLVLPRAFKSLVLARVYLLLNRAENVDRAVATGLPRANICAVDKSKMGLLAANAIAPGAIPLILNLFTNSSDVGEEEQPGQPACSATAVAELVPPPPPSKLSVLLGRATEPAAPLPKWVREYSTGAGREVYEVAAPAECVGKTYREALLWVLDTFKDNALLCLNRAGARKCQRHLLLHPDMSSLIRASDGLLIMADSANHVLVRDSSPHLSIDSLGTSGSGSGGEAKEGTAAATDTAKTPAKTLSAADAEAKEAAPLRMNGLTALALRKERKRLRRSAAYRRLTLLRQVFAVHQALQPQPPPAEGLSAHLIVCCSDYHALRHLLLPLKYCFPDMAVVVLSPTLPGREWAHLAHSPPIYFVRGTPQSLQSLLIAQILKARDILILSPAVSDAESAQGVDGDADVIFATRLIEKVFVPYNAHLRIGVVSEFLAPEHVRFLPEGRHRAIVTSLLRAENRAFHAPPSEREAAEVAAAAAPPTVTPRLSLRVVAAAALARKRGQSFGGIRGRSSRQLLAAADAAAAAGGPPSASASASASTAGTSPPSPSAVTSAPAAFAAAGRRLSLSELAHIQGGLGSTGEMLRLNLDGPAGAEPGGDGAAAAPEVRRRSRGWSAYLASGLAAPVRDQLTPASPKRHHLEEVLQSSGSGTGTAASPEGEVEEEDEGEEAGGSGGVMLTADDADADNTARDVLNSRAAAAVGGVAGSLASGSANDAFVLNSRFAAGKLFSSSPVVTLLAQAFYSPQCLTLLNTLTSVRPGAGVLYQVPVPQPCRGRTYRHLYRHLVLERGAVPLGLYRYPTAQNGAELPYVVTSPPKTMTVHAEDRVFVIIKSYNSY